MKAFGSFSNFFRTFPSFSSFSYREKVAEKVAGSPFRNLFRPKRWPVHLFATFAYREKVAEKVAGFTFSQPFWTF